MHSLAVLSMKNRALIALVTVVAALFGGIALTGLKQELIPDVSFPQLAVVTSYPGAGPEVVSDDVSTPIETAIQGVPGLESTTATSSANQSFVSATFTFGTDLATAEQKVTQAINRISSQLPDGSTPQVISGSITDLPVIQIAVASNGSQDELATAITDNAIPTIGDVEGVREAALVGDVGSRVSITPNNEELAAAGFSAADIRSALENNGVLIPAGSITEDGKTLSVQAGKKYSSVDQIKALPLVSSTPAVPTAPTAPEAPEAPGAPAVPGAPGAPEAPAVPTIPEEPAAPALTTIGDVADVAVADNPVTSISRVNGEPALTIAVTKLPNANTVDVSTGVRDVLPEITKALGAGVSTTIVFDQAPFIQQSIETLAVEGLLGLVFAVLVILVFLMDVRATIVTAISIPTSVLITLIGLQVADYTLNILTLGALTIAIGRVVDDSIVVIENIKRHLEFDQTRTAASRAAAVVEGVREVAGAITASTVTTVAVFLPLAFVGDMTGELFRPFALTVSIALLASLIVALTIVPVLAYWFLRAKKTKRGAAPVVADAASETAPVGAHAAGTADGDVPADGIVVAEPAAHTGAHAAPTPAPVEERPDLLHRIYRPIIHWTLRHSVVTVLISVVVLAGTLALAPLMKINFLGDSGQNTLTVTQTLPVGTSLEKQDDAAKGVEDALKNISGIDTVQLSIGSSGSALRDAFSGGGGGAVTYSITTAENVDQEVLQNTVRRTLADIKDAGDIEVAAAGGGFGASNDISIDVKAPTEDALREANDTLMKRLQGDDGIAQLSSNLTASMPFVQIAVDRDKAAEAGFSEVALGGLVSQQMQPSTAGTVEIDNTALSIYIQSEDTPTTLAEIKAIEIPTPAGIVPLSDLAEITTEDGPATITTERGVRTATISATPGSDNLAVSTAAVEKAISDGGLPSGATASIGGVASSQADAFSQLGLALLAAILIVYIVMVATFRSLLQPLLLLVSVPFAATGAIALQLITGIPLGVASLIGVLMLVGIVVTNAIVLVDLVNQYRRSGSTVANAVEHGALRRLRPILMTALATIFALTPMALGITGHGGFISQPLAVVVIGGLVSSTVLTLIVLPTLYNLVEGARERRQQRRDERAAG